MNFNDLVRPYLCHHGIKGQKWGIRRYQNPDGTLTEEGKKRYAFTRTFKKAESDVSKRISNKYDPLNEDDVSLKDAKKRGKLTNDEAKECVSLAEDIYKKAKAVEPKITNDVLSAVNKCGSGMYGLEHRLKTKTSIAGKIGSDAKSENVTFQEASRGINDAIRYTTISNADNFTRNYNSIKSELMAKGYSELKCKNYFDSYSKGLVKHKAVQSLFTDKDGNRFELQFQTKSSQAAKELKIPIYEERRRTGISKKRAMELEQQMTDLAEQVSYPKDVFTIRSH